MSIEQRNSSKLLMGIMGALVTVIILVFAYQWFSQSTTTNSTSDELSVTPTPKAPSPPQTETATPTPEVVEPNVLVEADLLDAPVPENLTLAKEELAKLEDLQVQLNEQKATLDAQHADADQLIKLKEEQMALLKAQLAQTQ